MMPVIKFFGFRIFQPRLVAAIATIMSIVLANSGCGRNGSSDEQAMSPGGEANTSTTQDTWQQIAPQEVVSEGAVFSVAAHPEKSGTLIAGTRPQGVLVTVDGGKHWRMTSEEFESTANQGINSNGLLFSKQDPDIVYAGIERLGIWKSLDGGSSWVDKNIGIASGNGHNAVSFAISPDDVNTVFAGTDGGLYKSVNGGATWQRLSNGLPSGATVTDNDIHSTVTAIAVNPDNTNVIYAAFYAVGVDETAGVYKSIDGGDYWSSANVGIETGPGDEPYLRKEYAFDLSLDPRDPDTLYVATLSGIYKSVNAGESWVRQYTEACGDILVDTLNSNQVYAIKAPGSVIRSDDGGNTWKDFSKGLPRDDLPSGNSQEVVVTLPDGTETTLVLDSAEDGIFGFRLAATPADPEHIYLAMSTGIYRVRIARGEI